VPPDFSLQSVLDYRTTIVETLEIELGVLLRDRSQLKETLYLLERKEQHLWQELIQEQIGDLDLIRIDQLQSHLEDLEEHKHQLLARLKTVAAAIHAKREELVAAKQDEEVLEIIKDKEIERFYQQVKKHEQKVQDDIYIAQAYQSRS
jgi:flagellar export protein FliJ